MNTSFAQRAVSDLLAYLSDNFRIEERAGVQVVHTPFLLPNHDCISIGMLPAQNDREDEIVLSDMGSVSDFFFTEGRSLEEEPALQDAASIITSRLGVSLELPYVTITTTPEEAGEDLYLLMLAALGIASQYEVKQAERRADFPSQVKAWLSDCLVEDDLPLRTDHPVPIDVGEGARVERIEYHIDVAVLHARPKFIQAVGNTSASWRAAAIYDSLRRHEVSYGGAVVYNEDAPGWGDHYLGVLEDSPTEVVVPYSEREQVLAWAREAA